MDARTALIEYVNRRLADAKAELKLEDLTAPFLVAMYETSPGKYSFKEKDATDYFINEESKDLMVKDLEVMAASEPTLMGLAVSFDGYSVKCRVKAGEEPKLPDKLSTVQGAETALITFVYARGREIPDSRMIPYVRKGNLNYWFGDDGWEEEPTTGRFANPFK